MYGNNCLSCLQVSGNTINDTVTTYKEAEAKCHSEGSRLLQIRSLEQLYALTIARSNHFGPSGSFLEHYSGSLVALGMKYGLVGGNSQASLYYRYVYEY